MAISERIHFFRTKNNMTMKELGNRLGFSEKTADVRIAQYETAKRLPKAAIRQPMISANAKPVTATWLASSLLLS